MKLVFDFVVRFMCHIYKPVQILDSYSREMLRSLFCNFAGSPEDIGSRFLVHLLINFCSNGRQCEHEVICSNVISRFCIFLPTFIVKKLMKIWRKFFKAGNFTLPSVQHIENIFLFVFLVCSFSIHTTQLLCNMYTHKSMGLIQYIIYCYDLHKQSLIQQLR